MNTVVGLSQQAQHNDVSYATFLKGRDDNEMNADSYDAGDYEDEELDSNLNGVSMATYAY
jgi:hypothetical protein